MYLLQEAYNKKDETIPLSNARCDDWEYTCPVCREKVIGTEKVGFKHKNFPERDEECALKWINVKDGEIADKYKGKPNSEFKKEVVKFEEDKKIFDDKKTIQPRVELEVDNDKYRRVNLNITKTIELMKLLSNIDFTQGQKDIINMFLDAVENDFKGKKMYAFSGRAGSGKTMTLSILLKICKILGIDAITGTLTGKASQVLREKGVDSNTLHSIMYKPIINELTGQIEGWSKNDDINCNLIFVDEFSMLDQELIEDILYYNKITIFFGDTGQLPPVGIDTLYLEDKIDIELIKICRQAEGSPVIKFANKVRDGEFLKVGIKENNDNGLFATLDKNKHAATIEKLKNEYDQMICGTNNMRHVLNYEYRKNKGYTKILHEGEKIVVLKNDRRFEVFNGQIFTVEKLIEKPFKDEGGLLVQYVETDEGTYPICLNGLIDFKFDFNKYVWENKLSKIEEYSIPISVNFSYALTCHKLQGSEVDSVLLFASDLLFMYYRAENKEKGKELFQRAIYTAVTRARKKCVVVL